VKSGTCLRSIARSRTYEYRITSVYEKTNWGLKTPTDNAYDGHEAVAPVVACSSPVQAYTCGQEAGNYGDAVTSIKSANQLWLTVQ
jgi:hypothetical protein